MKPSLFEIAKQADQFFMNKSPIHDTMARLSEALKELKIPFAIAASAHGHRRTTADVDVLMHAEGLRRFKEKYLGLGWLDNFEGSKGFRNTEHNVKVDVLLSGDFPGDGLGKPVAFPSPESVSEVRADGLPYVNLPTLIELKLASGMTAAHRPRDLDDVIQLIRANDLPLDYSESLNPFVHEKFQELWRAAQVDEDY